MRHRARGECEKQRKEEEKARKKRDGKNNKHPQNVIQTSVASDPEPGGARIRSCEPAQWVAPLWTTRGGVKVLECESCACVCE